MNTKFLPHRVHDYRHLAARWRRIAKAAGLRLEILARVGEQTLYFVRSRPERGVPQPDGGLYISAGIHGDEPAAPEALAQWAEARLPALAGAGRFPFLILPCLNPWGLVNNHRLSAEGIDLNRVFNRDDLAPVGQLKGLLRGRSFDLALTLHEDYDGCGFYLYELSRSRGEDFGEDLLRMAGCILPTEPRTRVDGRPIKNGLVRRRANLEKIPLFPEAIYLYLHHARHTFTFETPSEFSLEARVKLQVLLIEECAKRAERLSQARKV